MDLIHQSMDQFPMQQFMDLMELQFIQSPKKFILQKIMEAVIILFMEIFEYGIEHYKQLELLLVIKEHIILIS